MTYPCSTKTDLVILTTGTFYIRVSVSDIPRSIYITQGGGKIIDTKKNTSYTLKYERIQGLRALENLGEVQ